MIAGNFRLKNYDGWRIAYYIMTEPYDAVEILERLYRSGCSRKFLRRAEKLLSSGKLNIGLTYSNPKERRSVIVISRTTTIWEFFNSYAHEVDHLEKHISKTLGFSPYSEDASYLVGEIIKNMFQDVTSRMSWKKRCTRMGKARNIYL